MGKIAEIIENITTLFYIFCFVFIITYICFFFSANIILSFQLEPQNLQIISQIIINVCLISSFVTSFLFIFLRKNILGITIEKTYKIIGIIILIIFGSVIFSYLMFNITFLKPYVVAIAIAFSLIMLWPILYFFYVGIFNINYRLHQSQNSTLPYKTIDEYAQLLNDYTHNHVFIDMLQNQHIQIFFHDFGLGKTIRISNKNNNKIYELIIKSRKDYNRTIVTIWGIIQMYFNEKVTFNGLKAWVNLMDNIQIKQIKMPV